MDDKQLAVVAVTAPVIATLVYLIIGYFVDPDFRRGTLRVVTDEPPPTIYTIERKEKPPAPMSGQNTGINAR